MARYRLILPAFMLVFVATSAHAGWKGKGEAGLVVASGNTDATTVNVKLAMSEEDAAWKQAFDVAALRATNTGVTNAERYTAGWQSNYKFNERSFWFGGLRYEADKFSGFDYQASLSTGVGYKLRDTDKVKLSGQAGVGYRRLKSAYFPGPPVLPATATGNAVFVAGFDYGNQVTATTRVVDKFQLESGSDNTLLANFLGLEVKMSDALALSAGFNAHVNSKPPDGKKKTDTTTTLNLVYAF